MHVDEGGDTEGVLCRRSLHWCVETLSQLGRHLKRVLEGVELATHAGGHAALATRDEAAKGGWLRMRLRLFTGEGATSWL